MGRASPIAAACGAVFSQYLFNSGRFGNLSIPPNPRLDAFMARNGHRPVRRAESPFYRFQDVDLSPAEQAMLEGLDGQKTLADLCSDDEAMQRTLYGLVSAELLELGGEAVAAPAVQQTASKPRADVKRPAARPSQAPDADRRVRTELAAMAENLRGKSYFEMLDVAEDAPAELIGSAYERLAKKAHPDHFQNSNEAVRQLANEVFQLLSKAHDTLVDSSSRIKYLSKRKKGERTAANQAKNDRAVHAEVEFQHGEALLRQRDYERALAHFTRAKEGAPREGEYLAHYAWCFYLCNSDNATVVQEALVHMKRAVKLARDQEKPYLFLGRLCKVVGDSAGAEQMFTRAVQIRPDCVEAMRELRLINMRKDKGRGLIGKLLRR
jgi:tetratricopeptide (TPR) repeat protein